MFYKQLIQQRLWEKHEHIAWDFNIKFQELPSWILLLSISQWPTFKRIADFIRKPTFKRLFHGPKWLSFPHPPFPPRHLQRILLG